MWIFSCIVLVLGLVCPIFGQQRYPGPHGTNHTGGRKGVCLLEVPTLDILPAEERLGQVPRGNGSRPDLTRIEICCSGYERVEHTFIACRPVCQKGCENGNCTAPNVCTCGKGFIKSADNPNKCIPACPVGCLNGRCNRDVCECNPGYVHSLDRKYCVPVCTGGCGSGGTCTGPETCTCDPGFEIGKDNKCQYFCEGGCQNGNCIGPNQCSCLHGYVLKDKHCVPDCPRGCKKGICTLPNTCTCDVGWSLDKTQTECQPHCSHTCLNADCVAPEVCACKKGYVESPGSGGRKCVAYCQDGCENGVCSAPNFCICNPGFVKEFKGSNKCVRRSKRSIVSNLHLELIPEEILEGH